VSSWPSLDTFNLFLLALEKCKLRLIRRLFSTTTQENCAALYYIEKMVQADKCKPKGTEKKETKKTTSMSGTRNTLISPPNLRFNKIPANSYLDS
jgi:hypothetical protein